jgi:hypothetical protein
MYYSNKTKSWNMGFGYENDKSYYVNGTNLNSEVTAHTYDIVDDINTEYQQFLKNLWSLKLEYLSILNEQILDGPIYAILDNTIENIEVNDNVMNKINNIKLSENFILVSDDKE